MEGDDARVDGRLAPIVDRVYGELHALAARMMRQQRADHTLQATALVHEAFLRVAGSEGSARLAAAEFVSLAATSMRSVLVDHARRRAAERRGGGRARVPLAEPAVEPPDLDVVALDEALRRLAARDPRKASVVDLRYFARLSAEETADVLGISLATVKRDWAMAKAWLHREITDGGVDDG